MKARNVGIAAAVVLGLALLVLGPAGDRVIASETGAAAAEVQAQPDAKTLHCLREAAGRFQRCRRQGGSTGECTSQATNQFHQCMEGGGEPPK